MIIHPPVKIHPDPEMCEQFHKTIQCRFLTINDERIHSCNLFDLRLELKTIYPHPMAHKCRQCKEFYQSAKSVDCVHNPEGWCLRDRSHVTRCQGCEHLELPKEKE